MLDLTPLLERTSSITDRLYGILKCANYNQFNVLLKKSTIIILDQVKYYMEDCITSNDLF